MGFLTPKMNQALLKLKKLYESGKIIDVDNTIADIVNSKTLITNPPKSRIYQRINFLGDLLEKGVSRYDAAAALAKHDPKIGLNSARTIAYICFADCGEDRRFGKKTPKRKSKRIAVERNKYHVLIRKKMKIRPKIEGAELSELTEEVME